MQNEFCKVFKVILSHISIPTIRIVLYYPVPTLFYTEK